MGAALAASCGPVDALEYRRAAVGGGEVWRLLTGQLVHWSPGMAAADLLVIAAAGTWLERRSRRMAAACIAAALVAVGLAVHFLSPGLLRYRGSSGVATALVAALATDLALRAQSRGGRLAGTAGLMALGAKIAVEAWTGPLPFTTLPAGIEVASAAHLAGTVAGVGVGVSVSAGENTRT